MTTHPELLFPGFLQGLFSGHPVFLLFPLPLLILLCLPCLFHLPLLTPLLNALVGRSYLGPHRLLNPGLLGCRLALDLFEILFQIRVYWNRFRVYDGGGNSPRIDILGGGHSVGGFWIGRREILTLPM